MGAAMTRCTYGYSDGQWGKWELDSYDQCQRLEHAPTGCTWHFPESGGAVSKHGKRIDDPSKWEKMWKSVQKWEASDERSLSVHLWSKKNDYEVDWWLDRWNITPKMARTLVDAYSGYADPTKTYGILINRRLMHADRPGELTPLGHKMVEALKGWDRL